MDIGVLILRGVVGLFLAGHGAQKLFGWFGGLGPRRTAAWLETVGFFPAGPWALLAGALELVGGVLFALGFFCPLGSLGIAASMMTAIAKIHWPRVWASDGGFELPLKNLAVVVAVGISGPGGFSLDHVFHSALPSNDAMIGASAVALGWCYALISSTLAAASTGTTAPATVSRSGADRAA